jgi:tryptophan-rich sensory protein
MRINPLVLFIPIPLLLGSLIGNIGRPDKWYNNKLKKPELNPPNYIFPIVWTILYLMIGISYYLALSKTKDNDENINTTNNIKSFMNKILLLNRNLSKE